MSAPTSDPAFPLVPWNRWDVLDVPDLDDFTPTKRLSVVLPHYRAEDRLALTLQAIAASTYPADLLEVVVADDGSDVPPTFDADQFPFAIKVVTQERRGFGAARARNNGARAASGDILVFLDADMVPERQHLAAHARWHHAHPSAVTLGRRFHVEFDGITGEALRAATADGDIRGLFDGRDITRPEWLENHFARTDELTSRHDDLFRTVTSGNMGMRAETYFAVGGCDETFTQWGGEDTELGYRLFVGGAVLVSEPQAVCWHQGEGSQPDEAEQKSLEDQRAKLSHLVAHRGFRRSVPGRTFTRPRVVVRVDAHDAVQDAVVGTVESVLGSDFHDLAVVVELGQDQPDATWLDRQFDPDPRVHVVEAADLDDLAPHTPIVVEVGAGTLVGPGAVTAMVGRLESVGGDAVGVVHATVPGLPTDEVEVRGALRRALRRARAFGGDGADVWRLAGEVFGEAWLAGSDLGLGSAKVEPGPAVEGAGRAVGADAAPDPSSNEVTELWRMFSQLAPGERRAAMTMAKQVMTRTSPRQRHVLLALAQRLLAVVEAIAGIGRERSPRGAFRAVVRTLRALLPDRAYAVLRAAWRGARNRS